PHDQGYSHRRRAVMLGQQRRNVLPHYRHDSPPVVISIGGLTSISSTIPLVTNSPWERVSMENGSRSLLKRTQWEKAPSHVRTALKAGGLSKITSPRS